MTDEELALVTRLEGYRTTCCDDSRTVPDLIAIIRRLESENAALKAENARLKEYAEHLEEVGGKCEYQPYESDTNVGPCAFCYPDGDNFHDSHD